METKLNAAARIAQIKLTAASIEGKPVHQKSNPALFGVAVYKGGKYLGYIDGIKLIQIGTGDVNPGSVKPAKMPESKLEVDTKMHPNVAKGWKKYTQSAA